MGFLSQLTDGVVIGSASPSISGKLKLYVIGSIYSGLVTFIHFK